MIRLAIIAVAIVLLAGCSYDYLQHTDRVAYGAGDAVEHNLAQETVNPSKSSMYDKKGLGRNGPLTASSVQPIYDNSVMNKGAD
jgi:hypothetical protein